MNIWVSSSFQLFPPKKSWCEHHERLFCGHIFPCLWIVGSPTRCLIYREWPNSFQLGYAVCTGTSEHSSGCMRLAFFCLTCCCFIRCVLVSRCGFNLYCSIGEWCVGLFFHMVSRISSLEEVVFLLNNCRLSSHILDTSPLSKSIGNILSVFGSRLLKSRSLRWD